MPPRTFFVISNAAGEDELLCFHDQVSKIVGSDGHALIVLIDRSEIHLHAYTVREAIQQLFVPVYGSSETRKASTDVGKFN